MQDRELSASGAFDETEDLYNNAPCGFHSLDNDGVFIRVNETELRWLGYTREELIGKKKITDVLAPESVQIAEDSFDRFKLHGLLRDLEVHLLRKNGSILPVLVSATAVRDSQGNFVMSRSILYDITERKRAELKFRGLLEAAPDAMVVIGMDGRIALVNAQAEKIFGYAREQMLGQEVEMLMPERYRHRHASHRKDYCAQPKMRPMGAGLELYGLRKDGTEFSVEISLSPLETDEEPLMVGVIRDTTERNRMVEALRTSEERFHVALKNSPVVVFNQDHNLRYTWINSPVMGWASQDYLGHTDEDIVGGEEGARLMAIKQDVLRDGIGTRTETTVTFMGETHHFDLTVEPLRDALGAVVGVTCAAADVTPLKLTMAERERLIGELQEALASVKLLSGLLPICAGCKKIRDEFESWKPLETYISTHSDANFTHGMCPDCVEKFGWTAEELSRPDPAQK